MASTSEKSGILGEGASVGGFDRISSLPDEAAYYLLGLLDAGELSRVMLVSKRWNKLCMSVPVLTVDNSNRDSRYDVCIKNFLALRCKTGKRVRQFNFTWQFFLEARTTRNKRKKLNPLHHDAFCRIHEYYWSVVNSCGIECLRLSFMSGEPQGLVFAFPVDVTCDYQNLKELTICANNVTVWIPMSLYSPRKTSTLEKLTLQSCALGDCHFLALSRCLHSLKSLKLINCTGLKSLRITSMSLQCLRISNDELVEFDSVVLICPLLMVLCIKFYPSPSSKPPLFSITSFHLKFFAWFGFPFGTYSPDRDFLSRDYFDLHSALFHLLLPSRTRFPWDLSEVSNYTMCSLIAQLKMTKFLRLHSNTIELFFMKLKGCSSPSLSNVQRLVIDCCYLTDKEVPAICFLLQGVLELESLSITASMSTKMLGMEENSPPSHMKGMKGFDVKYWEAQDIKFLPQLTKATIEVWHGGNEVEFVKFILNQATALETLNILCDLALESSISDQVMRYKSQSTTVLFSSRPKQQKSLGDLFRDIFYF